MLKIKKAIFPVLQHLFVRHCSQNPINASEIKLKAILEKEFPKAKDIQVQDVSGGCGAMYEILVVSPEFKGLSMVKQHMWINRILKEEIKEMHGLRIHTATE